jgi:hypothetical protein
MEGGLDSVTMSMVKSIKILKFSVREIEFFSIPNLKKKTGTGT